MDVGGRVLTQHDGRRHVAIRRMGTTLHGLHMQFGERRLGTLTEAEDADGGRT